MRWFWFYGAPYLIPASWNVITIDGRRLRRVVSWDEAGKPRTAWVRWESGI